MISVVVVGNLARDPELSYTPNTQTAMCRFTVASNRGKRNGEDQGADFIRVTVWGRQAETCDRYLSKGRRVAVQGRLQTDSYTNREGVKVNTVEVIADNVEFIGGGNSAQGASRAIFAGGANSPAMPSALMETQETQGTAFSEPQVTTGGFDDMPDSFQAAEDDIPF